MPLFPLYYKFLENESHGFNVLSDSTNIPQFSSFTPLEKPDYKDGVLNPFLW